MFIVNFVIVTKFPLVLCVLKTVKMICNSIVYLIIAINIPSDVMTIIITADVGLKSELVERGF
jgi:hypothetical protein